MTAGAELERELAGAIKALKGKVSCGPRKRDEIDALEAMFDLQLPADYRKFLGNYGTLRVNGFAVFGIGPQDVAPVTIEDAILLLRLRRGDLPLTLVPIEDLGEQRFACIQTTERRGQAPVVQVDLSEPMPASGLPILASSFAAYLLSRIEELNTPRPSLPSGDAFRALAEHVREYRKKFNYDHATGGKLPRNHDWRPYRFCIQDVVFAATVVRHNREHNCLEVDVFLTAEVPHYDPLAGALALAAFLLSEAYKCGGTMEVRFTRNVAEGRVPQPLQQVAERYGVAVGQDSRDRLTPAEAKALYLALTGFSPTLQARLRELEEAGELTSTRAAFVVHHGVWTREEVETIVLSSSRPNSVLGGLALPDNRIIYKSDLIHARGAVLGGMLDRRLTRRDRCGSGEVVDLEDDLRRLAIGWDANAYAKIYSLEEDIVMPWQWGDGPSWTLSAGQVLHALIRARDAADLTRHFREDLDQAIAVCRRTSVPTCILVPADIQRCSEPLQRAWRDAARDAGIDLLVAPDGAWEIDTDAARRLATSRVLRK